MYAEKTQATYSNPLAQPEVEHRYMAGVNQLSAQAAHLFDQLGRLNNILSPVLTPTPTANAGSDNVKPGHDTQLMTHLMQPVQQFDKALASLEDLINSIRI